MAYKPVHNNVERAEKFSTIAKKWEFFSKLPLIGGYCAKKAETGRLAADLFINDMEFAVVSNYLSDWEVMRTLKASAASIRKSVADGHDVKPDSEWDPKNTAKN